jgi:ribosome biogenesis GTPase A
MRILSRDKDAGNRVDISNDELARHWRQYFGTSKDKIEAAVNPESVQKELRVQKLSKSS